MKNIEITDDGGLVCDNPECDWEDKNITFENLEEWLNKPCPKCGQNLLTEEDFLNAQILRKSVEFINTLTQEELEEFYKLTGDTGSNFKDSPMFKDAKGIDTLDVSNPEGKIGITISSHEKIKVIEVKNIEE